MLLDLGHHNISYQRTHLDHYPNLVMHIHIILVTAIVFVGALSNAIVVLVMTGNAFRSLHYIPYKALAMLEAMFCANQLVKNYLSLFVSEHDIITNLYICVYFFNISKFILSGIIYSAIYLTLLMIVDRYIAVCHFQFYRRCEPLLTHCNAIVVVVLLILVGFGLNSWPAFFVFRVLPGESTQNTTENHTMYRTSDVRYPFKNLELAFSIKEIYNVAIKIVTLTCQLGMAAMILTKLKKQRRKFPSWRTATITYATGTINGPRTGRATRQGEGFVTKFLLVISCVGLAREAFNEGNRIIKWVCGIDTLQASLHCSYVALLVSRTFYFIGTTIGMLDRAFKLYLYIGISQQFRRELLAKLQKCAPMGASSAAAPV